MPEANGVDLLPSTLNRGPGGFWMYEPNGPLKMMMRFAAEGKPKYGVWAVLNTEVTAAWIETKVRVRACVCMCDDG